MLKTRIDRCKKDRERSKYEWPFDRTSVLMTWHSFHGIGCILSTQNTQNLLMLVYVNIWTGICKKAKKEAQGRAKFDVLAETGNGLYSSPDTTTPIQNLTWAFSLNIILEFLGDFLRPSMDIWMYGKAKRFRHVRRRILKPCRSTFYTLTHLYPDF